MDGSGVLKRSVRIAGHRTSVSLEPAYWEALKALAAARGLAVQGLVAAIDQGRGGQNLSSAIRVFVLERARAGDLPLTPPDEPRSAGPA